MVELECPCGARLGEVVAETGARYAKPYRLLRCGRCRLISPEPFPTPEDFAAFYRNYGEYGDRQYRDREIQRRRGAAERVAGKVRRALGQHPVPPRFLEVGCSSGAFLSAFSQVTDLECHGVEFDPEAARLAAELFEPGRIKTGSLQSAAFPDGFFSALYLEQVIEHVPDTAAFLRECARILAPDGVILLGTPNFTGISARLLRLHWKEFNPVEHVRMFTPTAMQYHLRLAGFSDIVTYTGGLSLVWDPGRIRLLPVRHDRLPLRVVAKALGTVGLGDALMATARIRSAHAAQPSA